MIIEITSLVGILQKMQTSVIKLTYKSKLICLNGSKGLNATSIIPEGKTSLLLAKGIASFGHGKSQQSGREAKHTYCRLIT